MTPDPLAVMALRAGHRSAVEAVALHAGRLRDAAEAVLRGERGGGEGYAAREAAAMDAAVARRDAYREALDAIGAEG